MRQKFCAGIPVGGDQRTFVLDRSRPAMPRAISLDPLLTEMRSLRRRQPRPFRTSRADGYPGRLGIEDPLLHGIRADCRGHVLQATSGTRAAHMASNPKAIPVAVMYARIVRSPPRRGQNGDRASMTL